MSRGYRTVLLALCEISDNREETPDTRQHEWNKRDGNSTYREHHDLLADEPISRNFEAPCDTDAEMRRNVQESASVNDQPECSPLLFPEEYHDDSDDSVADNETRKPSTEAFLTENLEILWPEGKPVADAKMKDIRSYMHLIPEIDQGFYNNLMGDSSIEEDIEGYNGSLDFEVENPEAE